MRRIIIEHARRRATQKRGGDLQRIEMSENFLGVELDERLVKLDEAIDALEAYDERKVEVVKLRFFAGLTNEQSAAALGIAPATAMRDWLFSRAWLQTRMTE